MRTLRPQRGVSMIEAMVALAVLAFGVLGIAGLQVTLRQSSDIAKQRSEALRIAQQAVENARAFSVLTTTAGQTAYADLTSSATPTAIVGTNATYALSVAVAASGAAAPKLKTATVSVTWDDRAGQSQSVELDTSIAGIAPEIAGSLGVPANQSPVALPVGRNVGIPVAAVDLGNGSSRYTPPGGGEVSWLFDNLSGAITSICTTGDSCTTVTAFPLSGYVRFATDAAPTPAAAEVPPSAAFAVDVQVNLTSPGTSTVACYERLTSSYVAYICAVPYATSTPLAWSGRSVLSGLALADSLADARADRFKVCRYTPVAGDAPARGNVDHPLDYSQVTGPLTNQNFLVIRAGDGTLAYGCPSDDAGTPLVNGNTWPHQPRS